MRETIMTELEFELSASDLLAQEKDLLLPNCDLNTCLEIGDLVKKIGLTLNLPIIVEVWFRTSLIFHASLPGSTVENQSWIDRKARVVMLKQHSTLFERISAQERGVDWHKENNVADETHAIHGGGLPLITKDEGFIGILLISGLPQLEDHLLGVEVLTEFLARQGELL